MFQSGIATGGRRTRNIVDFDHPQNKASFYPGFGSELLKRVKNKTRPRNKLLR